MNQTNDNNAFAETIFIIKCLPENEQNKIPKKFIEFLDENKSSDYIIKINPNVGLENQSLLDETKELLKEIYLSYFISREEKYKVIRNDEYRKMIEEDLKNKKNPPDKIFNNLNNIDNQKNTNDKLIDNHADTSLIEYKKSFLLKFKDFIFKILNINNR